MIRSIGPSALAALILGAWFGLAAAQDAAGPSELESDLEALKQELIELNRELFLLEEDLLAPSDTQVAVFVAVDQGSLFELDSVQLKLNDKAVANYLYTERELSALQRGGVHRLFLGNLPAGEHEVVAFFTGRGPKGRDYKRGASLNFEKTLGPKYLELRVLDDADAAQPRFEIREWD